MHDRLDSPPNPTDLTARAQWAERICAAWRESVTGIIRVGETLVEAKASLPHGEYEAMVREDLPFGPRTARMLKQVAEDPRIRNHGSVLPPAWRTLAEISRLSDKDFHARLADGTIHPEMKRNDLTAAIRESHARRRLAAIRDAPLVADGSRFPVLLADPPWRYEDPSMGYSGRSIENHYPTMSLAEICALPVGDIAYEDAVLFLWTTAPQCEAGFEVIKAWGFRCASQFVWDKVYAGTGYWTRVRHELLLIARRGEMPIPPADTRTESIFCEPKREHSEKPDISYDHIELMYPDLPKLELFARRHRDGWAAWGNQLPAAAE